MLIEIIEVKTFEHGVDEFRDIIQVECWFTALTFVKDAAQQNLRCEIISWEIEF
jgi:hypothetical protein